jgi:ribosome recycling factor
MNISTAQSELQQKLQTSVKHFDAELKKLRTGRAHPSMLDGVMAVAYGVPTPLVQIATVTAPEAQQLQISPFDPSTLQAIVTAIRDNQALGLNPTDDGRVIRMSVPALNTERRQQIVKQLKEKQEDCMVTMRGLRHDALKEAEAAKKDKIISEDDLSRFQKFVDEQMAKEKAVAEVAAKTKEHEVMTM